MGIRVIRPGEGELAISGPIGARIIEDGSRTQHRLAGRGVTSARGRAAAAARTP